MQDHRPVAELIPEPFNDERSVGGNVSGRCFLISHERDQVVGRQFVEAHRLEPVPSRRVVAAGELTSELSNRPAQLCRTADAVALPERNPTGLAESRADQYAVVSDVFDAPAGGTQCEDVADA